MADTRYTLSERETLQDIALQVFGDAGYVARIIEYNKLDYPFITDDTSFQCRRRASGYARLVLAEPKEQDYVIPAGTQLAVAASASTEKRRYSVTQAAVLQAGSLAVDVPIECSVYGTFGNVLARTALLIETVDMTEFAASVPTALTNGQVVNVLKPGDVLLLPTDTVSGVATVEATDIYGVDLAFENDDFSVDVSGDLAAVNGLDNLASALRHRLMTPRGALPYSPNYGSGLHRLVGGRSDPYWQQKVELEVTATLRADARVADVADVVVALAGDGRVDVACNIRPVGEAKGQALRFSL